MGEEITNKRIINIIIEPKDFYTKKSIKTKKLKGKKDNIELYSSVTTLF